MLLVTGATGTTGMEVLRALKARGAEARALVRDETKAHHLRDLGFEPATGDLGDPRTLGPALEGVEKAYLVSPISPMQSEFEQAFLETAKEAGRQAHRQAVRDRRQPRGAAALRPHARQGRAGAQGVRHGLDAAAAHRLHAEHARLGRARARRHVLLAGPGRGVQHRRRPRRRRGRRRRAHRGGPRGQGVRPQRPRGGLLPRPGQARVRGRRARDRGRGDPGRDAQARARPRRRPAVERRGPERAVRGLRRAAAPRWSRRASRTSLDRDPRDIDDFANDHVDAFKEKHDEAGLGCRARDVRGRPHPRGLLSGPAARTTAPASRAEREDAEHGLPDAQRATTCATCARRRS